MPIHGNKFPGGKQQKAAIIKIELELEDRLSDSQSWGKGLK